MHVCCDLNSIEENKKGSKAEASLPTEAVYICR